jgi:hypothetical protein
VLLATRLLEARTSNRSVWPAFGVLPESGFPEPTQSTTQSPSVTVVMLVEIAVLVEAMPLDAVTSGPAAMAPVREMAPAVMSLEDGEVTATE